MKKIILILFLVYCSIINAQWVQQFSSSNATSITSINFIDSLRLVASGFKIFNNTDSINTGRILYTTNGGNNWNYSMIPDSINTISDIKIINPDLLYSCGNVIKNINILSNNSINYPTPLGYSLRKKEGVIYKGLFLRSTDQGITWKSIGAMPNNIEYLTNIVFFNKDYGFATCSIGNQSTIGAMVKTTNGGNSWDFVNLTTDVWALNSIYMIDSLNVISVGAKFTGIFPDAVFSGIIFKTSDAGNTWTYNVFPAVNTFNSLCFAGSSTGVCIGNANYKFGGVIYKTTNKGISWYEVVSNFTDTTYLNEVNFLQNGTGVIAGDRFRMQGSNIIFDKISVLKTTDDGLSWSRRYINSGNKNSNALNLLNERKYFLGGGNVNGSAVIYYTSNGGETFIQNTSNEVPSIYKLYQNYPNPFNPSTNIKFEIKKSGFVNLKIFNALGREVKSLVNENLQAGGYEVSFDGSNLTSGVYFYKLETGNFSETKKMVLVK